jgi:hypothetical protein
MWPVSRLLARVSIIPVIYPNWDFLFVNMSSGNRVTRLGDFSPVGRMFILGSFIKITEVAKIF